MWRLLFMLLFLAGCSSTAVVQSPPEPTDPYRQLLLDALNQQDLPLLQAAFAPEHPLERLDSSFADDPAWQKMASSWVADLVEHGATGQWQLRSVEALSSDLNRYQLRLIHSDFSVEYFFLDGLWDERGLYLSDMGNRLYQLSQVQLMQQLYLRIAVDDSELADQFGVFFDELAPLTDWASVVQLFDYYLASPQSLQQDRLLRELLLRSLMSQSDNWMTQLTPAIDNRLLAGEYPLLSAVICLQLESQDCRDAYQRLPADLRGDVALAAEIGIRQLHHQRLGQAQSFADVALASEVDYFPAYWLSLQLGIANQDHSATVSSLDKLVQRFDVDIDQEIVTQLYPDLGKQFLQSDPFRAWAKRYSELESR